METAESYKRLIDLLADIYARRYRMKQAEFSDRSKTEFRRGRLWPAW
jgi:hypothetical protein